MAHMRRALGPLTAIWLICQIGTVALVPVALWACASGSLAEQCECGHGPAATCPMHHKPSGRSGSCALKALNTSGAAILTALTTLGLIAEPPRSIQSPTSSPYPRAVDPGASGERPVPPDPPPPRI